MDNEKYVSESQIDSICNRLLDSEEHATDSAIPSVAEDAADIIRSLQREVASVKGDLWWLVGGGEFSAWFENSGVSLPVAAMKEWEEARRHFPELVEEDAAMRAEEDSVSTRAAPGARP